MSEGASEREKEKGESTKANFSTIKFLIAHHFHYTELGYIMFYLCIGRHHNREREREEEGEPDKSFLNIFSRGITCCAMSRKSR